MVSSSLCGGDDIKDVSEVINCHQNRTLKGSQEKISTAVLH